MKSSKLFLLLAVLVPTAVCVDLAPVLGQVATADNSDEIDPGFGVTPDEKPQTKEVAETTLVIETPGSYQVTNKDGVPWTSITITGDIDDSSSRGQTTVQFNNGSIDPPIINNATIKSSWGTTEGQSGDFGGEIKLEV